MTASNRLRDFFARWARLEEDKAAISADLKELFAEAKGEGFDTKAMRAAFRREAMDSEEAAKKDEHESQVELYLAALHGTPHARPAPAREEQNRGVSGVFRQRAPETEALPAEPVGSSGDEIPASYSGRAEGWDVPVGALESREGDASAGTNPEATTDETRIIGETAAINSTESPTSPGGKPPVQRG